MANEVAKTTGAVATTDSKNPIAIAANKIANIYISDISNLNAAVGVPMTDEAKRCAVNAILYLCGEMTAEVVQKLPKAQLVQVLQFVTINGLDVFSGQVFMDKRLNKKTGEWSIKATPMGSAYEIMTKRFGVDVKTVHPARIVHEGDEFSLPQFDGLKMTNVQFKPTLAGLDGKAIAVYYIIEKTDGTLDFAIATREGVAKNLMAQILNATLREESVNRGDLMKRLDGKTLDEILNDEKLAQWISPAYRSPASRESMIIQKMKKNALLHYTRDLGSKAYAAVASPIEEGEKMDMLSESKVVSYEDGEQDKPTPAAKIANFDVGEDGVVEAPPTEPEESAAKAQPVPEPMKVEPVEEKPQPKPEEKKVEKVSIFDTDDL